MTIGSTCVVIRIPLPHKMQTHLRGERKAAALQGPREESLALGYYLSQSH